MVEQTSALLHDAVDVAPVFDPHIDLTGGGAGILPDVPPCRTSVRAPRVMFRW